MQHVLILEELDDNFVPTGNTATRVVHDNQYIAVLTSDPEDSRRQVEPRACIELKLGNIILAGDNEAGEVPFYRLNNITAVTSLYSLILRPVEGGTGRRHIVTDRELLIVRQADGVEVQKTVPHLYMTDLLVMTDPFEERLVDYSIDSIDLYKPGVVE